MKKRLLVNALMVLVFAGIGYYCYTAGKSYRILLENLPYSLGEQTGEAIEALQVTIDSRGEPVFLLEGDRMITTAVGKQHVMKIEILDLDDTVIGTKEVPFSMADLDDSQGINVARAYREGRI